MVKQQKSNNNVSSIHFQEAMTTEVKAMTLSSMNWVGMVGFLGSFLGPKCRDIVLGGLYVCMHVLKSTWAKMCKRGDKRSPRG